MTAERVPGRVAAFFDLDKTVLATSSSVVLAWPFLASGLLRRSDLLRSAAAQLSYVFVAADHRHSERVREQLSRVVAGWEVERLRAVVADAVTRVVRPFVYRGALRLVTAHQEAGHEVVVISAANEDIAGPIARMLGADEVIASRMDVVEGRYTGRIEHYVYGPAKAEEMRRLAAARGYDLARCWAYTDSVTDLPMLEAVGHPVAVNPDRALRRTARARGWPVRRFVRPVPLRASAHPLTRRVLGLTAAGVAGVWLLRRAGTPDGRPPAPERRRRARSPRPRRRVLRCARPGPRRPPPPRRRTR